MELSQRICTLICLIGVGMTGCSQRTNDRQRQDVVSNVAHQWHLNDDASTRLVRRIDPEKVGGIRFFGSSFGERSQEQALRVTKPATIRKLLSATSHSSPTEGARNRSDTMEIQLTEPLEGYVNPFTGDRSTVVLRFNAGSTQDAFGPDFQKALEEVSAEAVMELRQQVQRMASNTVEVRFGSHFRVKDKSQVKEIMEALQQVDERAFAFTKPQQPLHLTFLNTQKQSVTCYLALGPWEPTLSPSTQSPKLPLPLWNYYLRALSEISKSHPEKQAHSR